MATEEDDETLRLLEEDLARLREVDALLQRVDDEPGKPNFDVAGNLVGATVGATVGAAGAVQLFCATQVRPGVGKLFACLAPRRGSTSVTERLGMRASLRRSLIKRGSMSGESESEGPAQALPLGLRRERVSTVGGSSLELADAEFCEECGEPLEGADVCPGCGADKNSLAADEDLHVQKVPIHSRLSVSREQRVRRATLTQVDKALKRSARRRVNTMDAGFRRRLQEAQKTRELESAQQRRDNLPMLRRDFFSGATLSDVRERLRATAPKPDVYTELQREDSPRRQRSRSEAQSSVGTEELVDVPKDQEAFVTKLIDDAMAANLLKRDAALVAKNEKQLHVAKIRHIKVLRNNLLTEQARLIANVRAQSKAVIKGLRKHVAELTSSITKKLREEDDAEGDLQGMISDVNAVAEAYSRSVSMHEGAEGRAPSGDQEEDFDGFYDQHRKRVDIAQQLLQQRFEARLGRLQEELATTVGHLNDLELEQYYPKSMNWKVRLNSGDGLFIGMRDVDLEMLDADVEMGRGAELGTVVLNVTNINAVVGIYQFSIDGSTVQAKLLRGLLTPTVNRLDLELSGTWRLKLRFQPGSESADHRPKWVKEDSEFELQLTKEISGASLVRLPDRIVRWLTTQLIPQVISNAVMLNLPTRLGAFFQHPQNYLSLKGTIKLRGEIPPRVWTALLMAPTPSGELARRAMGLTYDEAVMLDVLLRGDLATTAGFHRKSISIYRLYKWRLQYASIPLARLEKILSEVEGDKRAQAHYDDKDAGPINVPNGWLLQLVHRVSELARKPVKFDLEITEIEADINVQQMIAIGTGMYLDGLEHEVEVAIGRRAKLAAQKKVEDAKTSVANIERVVRYTASLLADSVSMDLRGAMTGGLTSGIIMAHISNLMAQLRLPADFEWTQLFGEAPITSKGFNLSITGQAGPEEDEYTLSAKHRFVDPSEYPFSTPPEEDARASIRDLQLNLFPANAPAGTIRLSADAVRASLFMATLGEATYPFPEAETMQSMSGSTDHEPSFADEDDTDEQVEELLQRSRTLVSGLWSRYMATQADLDPDAGNSQDFEHPGLPTFMTSESHDLVFDIRGIKLEAIREIGVDQKETIRVTMRPSTEDLDPGAVLASAHMRFTLSEYFD